jgi:putative heme iron utilization protein
MDSARADDYAAATADPLGPHAGGAVEHLNVDHSPALADMARVLGGYPDAESAACTGIDRYGLDLKVQTPRGDAYTRVGFGRRLESFDELRPATVELARRARGV